MRISDWSSDVCSSDLQHHRDTIDAERPLKTAKQVGALDELPLGAAGVELGPHQYAQRQVSQRRHQRDGPRRPRLDRSEEHTSELQSLMRLSYAVFCLKKKKHNNSTRM